MPNGDRRRLLGKAARKQEPAERRSLSRLVLSALGALEGHPERPYVALKYYDPGFECFSEWRPDELRAFSDFNRKLGLLSWQRIYETGGRRKTGLGFTQHDENARVPRLGFLDQLDPDIRLFELRVTLKARVHGFRAGDAFFLVLLDREHRVYPE
jgi:hypothetical protein